MTANQKFEYMYAELQVKLIYCGISLFLMSSSHRFQSKKKVKSKKKPAAKTKASVENAALRECVVSLQENEAALIEKVCCCCLYVFMPAVGGLCFRDDIRLRLCPL